MANQYNDILASQIAEPATSDENLELYRRVAAGDTAARQEMIERNMALVLSRTDAFLQARPGYRYLRDDLVGAGSIGLVEAVNDMMAGAKVEQPSGYLSAAITHSIRLLAGEEATISVSDRTQRRAKDNGDSSPAPTQVNSTYL